MTTTAHAPQHHETVGQRFVEWLAHVLGLEAHVEPTPTPGQPHGQIVLTGDHAIDVNNAISAHGYKAADSFIYKAFQREVGLSDDGFPGRHSMTALARNLANRTPPVAMTSARIYDWYNMPGGYNGANAPTTDEWLGETVHPAPPLTTTAAPATMHGETSSLTEGDDDLPGTVLGTGDLGSLGVGSTRYSRIE